MRQVAGSVAVVLTDGWAGRHGATVTAFCSVSADPPTILICLRTDSRICGLVEGNGHFSLNILPEDAREVARAFAGERDADRPDRFAEVVLVEREDGPPVISDAVSFTCDVVKSERHASHTIVIGHVQKIAANDLRPLTYHDGTYCSVQREMSESKSDQRMERSAVISPTPRT